MIVGHLAAMIRESIKRAWKETLQHRIAAGFLAALAFALSFGIYWLGMGASVALDEFWIWAASVGGMLGALCLLFMFNLACAPYRIERDRRRGLEARIGEAGSDGGVLGAFRGRESYTLGEVAKLLTTSSDHRELVLDDLKRAVVSKELDPIVEKNSWEEISIRTMRGGLGRGPGDLSDEIRVAPDQLKEYLPKAGYGLPQWLESKPA